MNKIIFRNMFFILIFLNTGKRIQFKMIKIRNNFRLTIMMQKIRC